MSLLESIACAREIVKDKKSFKAFKSFLRVALLLSLSEMVSVSLERGGRPKTRGGDKMNLKEWMYKAEMEITKRKLEARDKSYILDLTELSVKLRNIRDIVTLLRYMRTVADFYHKHNDKSILELMPPEEVIKEVAEKERGE